jgi:polyhydroxyalkanoate synthesis regulator phasin
MAKQKARLDPAKQAERFREAAQKMIDAGELDPTEAERALDTFVRQVAKPKENDDA